MLCFVFFASIVYFSVVFPCIYLPITLFFVIFICIVYCSVLFHDEGFVDAHRIVAIRDKEHSQFVLCSDGYL